MNKEKYFEFHWKDGNVEYFKGVSVSDAARKSGIGHGAIFSIDYHAEAKSLPLNKKELWLVNDKGSEALVDGTLFERQAREQIAKGLRHIVINIANKTWNCEVKETRFRLLLTEK